MVRDPRLADRVAAAWREVAGEAGAMPPALARPVAFGWATVDLERATAELAASLDLPPGNEVFRPAHRSAALGAACRVAPGVLPDGGSLVVLEPDTEGLLAGSLARLGEGPVAAWLAVDTPAAAAETLSGAGLALSTERDGPFGVERLVVGSPGLAPGRYRLLVVRSAGTIHP